MTDRFFKLDYEDGPFHSFKTFNDWVFCAAIRQRVIPPNADDPYREFLLDSGGICFTHGDLTLNNIIIAPGSSPRRIAGIIDWEQSGWYPDYWEYCKLLYGVEYTHEWREAGWAEKVMRPFESEWFAIAQYFQWRDP